MHDDIVPSDVAILDLLRKKDSLSVIELAEVMQVTATAVRQRLTRLMAQGYIGRETSRAGRGRPSHRYVLTQKGRRKTGANFADLAIALWAEIRAIQDAEVRSGLIQRIARRLAELYANQVDGDSVQEKLEALAEIFNDRRVPFIVEPADASRQLPVLTALACPYPELAEKDRSVCAMERLLFAEVLGESVKLSKCRLDGDSCCSFEVGRREGVRPASA
jgi:predicted ArsR family transcriptional regulator